MHVYVYDGQVVDALMYSMRSYGARFIMGEQVDRIENMGDRAVIHLSTGTATGDSSTLER
jgi:phytoene dehydrogenase-like protein